MVRSMRMGVHLGVVWWVWGEGVWAWGLGSGKGGVGWGEWVGVLWCSKVDGGRCLCNVR